MWSFLVRLNRPAKQSRTYQKKVIDDLLETKLDVYCICVAGIHKLGMYGGKKPVILFLQDQSEKDKMNVLRNSPKLKRSKIFILNDYSPENKNAMEQP